MSFYHQILCGPSCSPQPGDVSWNEKFRVAVKTVIPAVDLAVAEKTPTVFPFLKEEAAQYADECSVGGYCRRFRTG